MPSRKTVKKPAAKKAVKKAAKAAVKAPRAAPVKTSVNAKAKPAAKASKKTVNKAPVKKAPVKKASSAVDSSKLSTQPIVLLEEKAVKKGENIESLIRQRDVQLKSVEEYIGIQRKQDMSNRPEIPGVFDLLIPPGTPRKLVINLAKKYGLQIVRRDDIYVPVGVCDIERDLLAIRGDKKTISKMQKILYQEIEAFINSKDARLHDYSKTPRLEGIGLPESKPKKVKASK
jgi:hypothetical protein